MKRRKIIATVLTSGQCRYPAHQKIVQEIIHSEWGKLFHNWEKVAIPPGDLNAAGWKEVGRVPTELKRETLKLIARSVRILGTGIKEAPEFSARKRHHATAPTPQGSQ